MLLPIIVLFLLAFAMLLLRPQKLVRFFKFFCVIPFVYFIYFLSYLPKISTGAETLLFNTEWTTSHGVSFDFKLDGLSMLFSLMITGIGTLIYFYASEYLKK